MPQASICLSYKAERRDRDITKFGLVPWHHRPFAASEYRHRLISSPLYFDKPPTATPAIEYPLGFIHWAISYHYLPEKRETEARPIRSPRATFARQGPQPPLSTSIGY